MQLLKKYLGGGDQDENDMSELEMDDSASDVSTTIDSPSDSDASLNDTDDTTGNDSETKEEDEEEEEEDDLIKAIRREQENIRELPRDIVCEDYVVQISFHPQEHIIALATMMGDVQLYKYCDDAPSELVNTVELHTRACRDIEFSADGTKLYSVSKDKSMMVSDATTGKLVQAYEDAHEDPLYCMLLIGEHMVATGDDAGMVKLWDVRQQKQVFALKEVNEFISSMITTDAKRHLSCTAGEGAITVLNIGQRKLFMQSEMYGSDLNCQALVRGDSKLAVGTSDNKLLLFTWGEFAEHNDLFPGPKDFGINKLLEATNNIVISGCDDGNIRATNLYPHRHLGVIGQHQFAVETLDISGDGRLIASSSHDQTVKFWDITYLEDVHVDASRKTDKKQARRNLPSSKIQDRREFFQGLGTSE